MGLDRFKLEKVRCRGSNTIARCPACAETGGDRKGEHLFISDAGQLGCVLFPGADGQQHRQRIFELAGEKDIRQKTFKIRKTISTSSTERTVLQKDILGHLGRMPSTHARKNFKSYQGENEYNAKEDSNNTVPSVPEFDDTQDIDGLGPRPY
jgi:hypothetical protein